MKPRDYQIKCEDSIFEEWKEKSSTLIVIPTGGGKTHVIAGVIHRMSPKRSIVLAHREELIWQARDKIQRVVGMECSIEMGEYAASTNLFNRSPVVIATIQTLITGTTKRRMTRFDPMAFGCLIVDEAHHATSPSYRMVLDHFKQNPALKILGVTATPDRSDEEALGQIFESVAFDYEILDAIHDGWLVPIEQQMVSVAGLDYSHIRTTAGDLNGADLSAVMEAETILQGVAGASIEIIGSRRAIIFTASVKQAETICNILNRHRDGMAGWVCGATAKDVRHQLLAEFQDGRRQVVCNCSVLTEGFDNPGVEVIVMAKPTKSRALYAQMAGRSTRPLPGVVDGLDSPEARRGAIASSTKPSCLIVDFVGNSGRHKLMTTADILGGNVSEDAIELAVRKAKEKGVPVNMTKELEDAEEELRKKIEAARLADEARKARLVARVKYVSRKVDPFNCWDLSPVRERGWHAGKALSEKQRQLLMRQGLDPDSLGYAQGKQVLIECFRRWNGKLASLKQCDIIKKRHPAMDTKDLTQQRASSLIDAISLKEGWKRN